MEHDTTAAGNKSIRSLFFESQGRILDNFYARSGLIIVYVFIFLICVAGNLAVILVVTFQWKARLLSKFYLLNLAAANLSVAVFCIPQTLIVYLLDRWIFGELMCKMFHFITSLCQTVSILSLVVVSIERYMALLHPFSGRQVLTVGKVVLLLVWLVSAGSSLPRFFYCGLVRIPTGETGRTREICVLTSSMYTSAVADTVYFIVLYALPLAALSVMYLRFGVHMRKYEKLRGARTKNGSQLKALSGDKISTERHIEVAPCIWIASTPSSSAEITSHSQMIGGDNLNDSKKISEDGLSNFQVSPLGIHRIEIQRSRIRLSRRRKRQSLVRMLTSIFVTFALLNLPFHVLKFSVNFLPNFHWSSDVNNVMAGLAFVLMYINCAVNPILYVLMSGRFRQSLSDLVCKLCGACSCNPLLL